MSRRHCCSSVRTKSNVKTGHSTLCSLRGPSTGKIAKPDCLAARLSRPQPAKTSQKSALLVLDSSGKIGNVSCMRGGVLCSDLARFTGGCSTLSPKWGAVCHEWSHVEKGFGLKHCQHTWNPRLHLFPGFAKSQAPLLKVLQMGFPCGVI